MALLPQKLRFRLFDTLSLKTMRYVHAVSRKEAGPLVDEIYDQIARDFFINGSLTSRSKVPGVLAAIWTLGRETILVDDRLDRTTKEAMTATLSSINDCPYCGDMLVSLVHAGDRKEDARQILDEKEGQISDPVLRQRLTWVRAIATPGNLPPDTVPFAEGELPEVIGSLMAMSDVNRFSHVVMDGSPVNAPFNSQALKAFALGAFGLELRPNHKEPLSAGDSLRFTAEAELPADMNWAAGNPRIAQACARWAVTVERESEGVIPDVVRLLVQDNLEHWDNEQMPLSRSWVEDELDNLQGENRDIARLCLLLAKASYQIDETVVRSVIAGKSEERFIRILAWGSFTAARYVASRIARICHQSLAATPQAA